MIIQDSFSNTDLYNFYQKVSNGSNKELCDCLENFCTEEKFSDMLKALPEGEYQKLGQIITSEGSEVLKHAYIEVDTQKQLEITEQDINEKILKDFLNL